MCQPATCTTCNKTTWKGCGQHIAVVKASVNKKDWCACSEKDRKPTGFFSSLFGGGR